MIVELPGFEDLTHDSQSTFRVLLNALSHPGTINKITAQLTPPWQLNIACAAASLTLLDIEILVWLQPGLNEEVKNWLLFHTGCRFTENTKLADFAVIWDVNNMPSLSQFKQGTPVYPENSTTLLITVEAIGELSLQPRKLIGAGIKEQITMPINLPEIFWQQWQQNHNSYPLGIDIYFFYQNKVLGLPRTSKVI
ncbi:phosphonate C-P lyase system protein PhnH [Myxosarcina sp. GI1]|uniref:phosphonate C-P lyase system protein PhnH n=1 Tax=Myxosarcina sp. GI1 TaxID=1541065 RepID=UPI000565E8D4|nr:phosphonate C-P lyase system protein PhnH [Myxosarcina sp. GI1]